MLVRIPANYRQSFKWFGNLDAPSATFLVGGLLVAMRVVIGQAPWAVKGVEVTLSLLLGAGLGLLRWPMDVAGDRSITWLRRYFDFARRGKRFSYFDGMVHLPRRRSRD